MKSVKSYKTAKTFSTQAPSQMSRSQRKAAIENLTNAVASKLGSVRSEMQPQASSMLAGSSGGDCIAETVSFPREDEYLNALACPGERPAPYIQNGRTTTGFNGVVRGLNDKLAATSKEFGLAVFAPIIGSSQASSGFYATIGDTALSISASNFYASGFVATAINATNTKGYTAAEPPAECSQMLTWANEMSLTFEAAAATIAGSLYYKYVPWWSILRGASVNTAGVTSSGVRIPLKPGHEYKFRLNVQQPWGISNVTGVMSQELALVIAWHAPAYSITTGALSNYTPVFKFKGNWFGQPQDTAGWMSGGSTASYAIPSKMPIALKESILADHGIHFTYKNGLVRASNVDWEKHPPLSSGGLNFPTMLARKDPVILEESEESSLPDGS